MGRWFWRLVGMGWLLVTPMSNAQLIDDIDVRSEQGVTEFRLQFSMPIRYLKHFPEDQGELVKIYLQAVVTGGLDPIDLQAYKRTPSAPGVPPFTIQYTTVRSCYAVLDPVCLDIQFSRPARFKIRPGEDGRSLVLVVLPDSNAAPAPKRK